MLFLNRTITRHPMNKGIPMPLDKKYHTGVIWQDFQHKELVNHLIKLKQAKENKADKEAFRFAVAFLAMYVHHHFKLEEEYMDLYGYPEKQAHGKKHKAFIKTLKAFRSKYPDYSEDAVDELIKEINEWILNHIFKDDKRLGAYILESENA